MPNQHTDRESRPEVPAQTQEVSGGKITVRDYSTLSNAKFNPGISLQDSAQEILTEVLNKKPSPDGSEASQLEFNKEVCDELTLQLLIKVQEASKDGQELRLYKDLEAKLSELDENNSLAEYQYAYAQELAISTMRELEAFHTRQENFDPDDEGTLDLVKEAVLHARDREAAAPAYETVERIIREGDLSKDEQYHPESVEFRLLVAEISSEFARRQRADKEKQLAGEETPERFYHRKVVVALLDNITEQAQEIRLKYGQIGAIQLNGHPEDTELIEAETLAKVILDERGMLTDKEPEPEPEKQEAFANEDTPVLEFPIEPDALEPDTAEPKPESLLSRASSWVKSKIPRFLRGKQEEPAIPTTDEFYIDDLDLDMDMDMEPDSNLLETPSFTPHYEVEDLGNLQDGEVHTIDNGEEYGYSGSTALTEFVAHAHQADSLSKNEDALGIMEKDGVTYLIDADGMGGHIGGITAARDSVRGYLEAAKDGKSALDFFEETPEKFEAALDKQIATLQDRLTALKDANRISAQDQEELSFLAAVTDPKAFLMELTRRDLNEEFQDIELRYAKKIGACVVCTSIEEHGEEDFLVSVAHLGDARLYLFDDTGIIYQTVDHSHLQQMVEWGILKPNELANIEPDAEIRRIVTKANALVYDEKGNRASYTSGDPEDVDSKKYFEQIQVKEGTKFLLCSDKIVDNVPDEILEAVVNGEGSLQEKALKLQGIALAGPKPDHLSIELGVIKRRSNSPES